MNFLRTFEDHVAGIFGTVEAPFSFKKLAKQAAREMESQTLVINGVNTAPALYTILIANDDDPLMAPLYPQLAREVSDFVKARAQKKGYAFVGEPLVRFMIDPALKAGKFTVFAENVDAPTLGRLYEEERAYQQGLKQQAQGFGAQAAREGGAAQDPFDAGGAADPFAVQDPFAPSDVPAASVPQTVLRDDLSGLGGAAAAGAATGIGANLAQSRAQARPLAQLVDVVTGDTFEVTSSRCVVGRERAAADIVLRDPNVSRSHAELIYTGSDWSIEDLNSTNGTLVNNRRVTRCPLRNGDLLTFGLSTFEFRG